MIERYSRPEMKRVWSDENKFATWLKVEIAVCEASAELGRIPTEAMPGIRQARFNLERIGEILKVTHHDMTAFLGSVAESVGADSRFIHLGLTSSDVMDTALALQLKEACLLLRKDIENVLDILRQKAVLHKDTVMMGRTHGVHAEPTTFGLKLALWLEEMKRNLRRLEEAEDVVNVGKISGAVGTYATVPPQVEEKACARLGIKPAPISSQIVQRDRHAQFLTALAIAAGSLEKFATELRGLQRTEVLEVEEPFAPGQTGSSAMPHKRNPELAERLCGLSRVVRGHAVTALENIALWHERDISHSSAERIILPGSCLLLDYMLDVFAFIMAGLQVYPENMKRNMDLSRGVVFSQSVLLALIDKGMTRQQAYEVVQRNAHRAWRQREDFLGLLKEDLEVSSRLTPPELEAIFDYRSFLKHVDHIFGRLGLAREAGQEVQT